MSLSGWLVRKHNAFENNEKSKAGQRIKVYKHDRKLIQLFELFLDKCAGFAFCNFIHQPLVLDPSINIDFGEDETIARLKLVKKLNKHGFQFKITNSIKKTIKLQQNKERGSQFIGVSKNGSCWQVALLLADQKHYICSVDDISIAAIINDMVTI